MDKELKKKLLSCFLASVFTFGCCFLFEGKSVVTQGEVQTGKILPIITYYNVTNEQKDNTVSFSQLQKDLDFIKEKGYNAVVAEDVLNYARGISDLPENPIFITFDGGYKSVITTVYPLLEKYNIKATVNIIGEYTDLYSQSVKDDTENARLSWDDVKFLHFSDLVEIGNQSYAFYGENKKDKRKGANIKKNEDFLSYKKVLTDDVLTLQQKLAENIYKSASVFAYPHGFYSVESEKILKGLGFDMTLTDDEGINYISKDKSSLFKLKRFKRVGSIGSKEFFAKIEE